MFSNNFLILGSLPFNKFEIDSMLLLDAILIPIKSLFSIEFMISVLFLYLSESSITSFLGFSQFLIKISSIETYEFSTLRLESLS